MKAKCKTTNVLKTEYDPQAVSQPARGVRNGQRLKKAARTASEPAFPDALLYNFLGSFATGTSNRSGHIIGRQCEPEPHALCKSYNYWQMS